MSDSPEVYEIYSEAELRKKVTKLFEDKGWETKTLQYAGELSKENSSKERLDLIPDIALLNNELKGIVKVKMYESANIESWRYWHKRLQEEAEQEAEQLIKILDVQFVMLFISKKAIIYAKGNKKDSYKILRVDKIPTPKKINKLIRGAKDVSTIETNGEFASFLNSKGADQKKRKKSEKDKEPQSEINLNSKSAYQKDASTRKGIFARFLKSKSADQKKEKKSEKVREPQSETNRLIDYLERLIARHQLNVNSQDLLSYSEKLHLLDIYQSEHQHRDGMYWKQAFAYFAAIFSLIILPRTEKFHFEDIPQWLFPIAGVLLALAWVFLVFAYRRRFMSINDAYNRVNQMLPEYYRRGPLYKESETSPIKDFVNLRMTTVVGVIFAILLIILAIIICIYPMKYPINVALPHCCK